MTWIDRGRRLFHTARHLRLTQAVALLRHKMTPAPRPGDTAGWGTWHPGAGAVVSALGGLGPVDTAAAVAARVAAFEAGKVTMLGLTVPWREALEDCASVPPLWRYHFHYHDLLADAAWIASKRHHRELQALLETALEGWIRRCETGGRLAWDPYPVSVRLVNWLRIFAWTASELGAPLLARMRGLHAQHLDLLSRRFEWHLSGNHVLRNAWALLIGARCWAGKRALAQRRRSQEVYFDELLSQVGEDGMHEERSPMYHARALRDALEALTVLDSAGELVAHPVRQRVRAMAEVLPWLRRCDGGLALLNDSAHDHGVDLDRLLEIAASLLGTPFMAPNGVRVLANAHLVMAFDRAVGDRLMVDVGPPGPAHQPGHAHAGALGIEVDLGGHPLLVDPGCSGYDGDPFRQYLRSTRAHNTIGIDAKDQSELWGVFRVGRRASVTLDEATGGAGALYVRAACAPYHDRALRHERTVRRRARVIAIEDRVVGGYGTRVDLYWHLHPDWSVHRHANAVTLRHGSGARASLALDGVDVTLHRGERDPALGWYARGFGDVVPSWVVRGTVSPHDGRTIRTVIRPEG